jgi:HAE1 family hydrophobic/amphiphilic exporter-1
MREDGMEPGPAIIESVHTRIRPIFMTTITTLFGLLPLVLMPGAGSELYRGLGAVVLGGLAFSTLFTLILVPSLFTLMLDMQRWIGRQIRRVEGSHDHEHRDDEHDAPPRIPEKEEALPTTPAYG